MGANLPIEKTSPPLAAAALFLLVVGFDALGIAVTSQLLWVSGGYTVFRGSDLVIAAAFLTCTLCTAARITSVRRAAHLRSSRALWLSVGISESLLLVSCLYLGMANSDYQLRWAAAFAAGYLLMNAVIQAVLTVLFRLGRGQIIAGLVHIVAAVVVLAFTTDVWVSNNVISDLIVFVGGALLAAEIPAALAGLAFPPDSATET